MPDSLPVKRRHGRPSPGPQEQHDRLYHDRYGRHHGYATDSAPGLIKRIVATDKAMLASDADNLGMYTDTHVMAANDFWDGLRRIHEGRH